MFTNLIRKLFCLTILSTIFCAPVLAITPDEYAALMSNLDFARADKQLTDAWRTLQRSAPKPVINFFEQARIEQLDYDLDRDAEYFMEEEEYPREQAYVKAAELCLKKVRLLQKALTTPMKPNKLIGQYVHTWDKVEGVEWLQNEINETGYLDITWANKKKSEVKLELLTYGGGGQYTPNIGEWSGRGIFKNSVLAISDKDIDNAHIIFVFTDDNTVMVVETSGMSAYQGMGAFFNGEYKRKKK